jgi:hypothetical protein
MVSLLGYLEDMDVSAQILSLLRPYESQEGTVVVVCSIFTSATS